MTIFALLLTVVSIPACAGRTEQDPGAASSAMHPYGLYGPGTIEELNPRTGNIVIAALGMDSVSQYQDYSLSLVRELGVTWVRIDFIYSRTGFFAPEGYLDKIESAGIEIVGCIRSTGRIEDMPAYLDGVSSAVRGHPEITSWQIGNEPNMNDKYTPAEYAGVFTETRQVVKRECPGCKVALAGAAIPYLEERSDRAYYNQAIAAIGTAGDGSPPFDAIDLHVYGAAGDYAWIPALVGEYRDILANNGFDPAGTAIWLTETATYSGKPTNPPGYPAQSEEQQAAELIKRFTVMASLGAERVAWSRFYENYQYARVDNGYYDNTGLVYNGLGPEADAGIAPGTQKQAFMAYGTLAKTTDGYTHIEQLAPGQYRFDFDDGRAPVYVLWAEGNASPSPDLAGELEVTDYAGSSRRTSELQLGYMPVFARRV